MLQDLLGTQLDLPVRVAIAAIVIAVLLGLTVLIVRRLSGMGAGSGGRSRQARLAVLDSVALDQRRRLVLVRRDETEHLLLVGGPSDLVVEPGIQRAGREPAVVKDGGRESPALREPTQRDALPRRPVASVLSAPPADATPGRLSSPARAELLARPEPVAPSAPPSENAEPVDPQGRGQRTSTPATASDSVAEEETPDAKIEPTAASVETRRPFSFRRPAAAEGEPASPAPAAPTAPALAPRTFTRPAASDRGARPSSFSSHRTPTALRSAATLGAAAAMGGSSDAEPGVSRTKDESEHGAGKPDVTAKPTDTSADATDQANDSGTAALGAAPDASPSDEAPSKGLAEEVRGEEHPSPTTSEPDSEKVVTEFGPHADTAADDVNAGGRQPEVSVTAAEEVTVPTAPAFEPVPFALQEPLESNDRATATVSGLQDAGPLDSPLPESPVSPVVETEAKVEAPAVEAQRFEPPVFDLPPAVASASESAVSTGDTPVSATVHSHETEPVPDTPTVEPATESVPVAPPLRREPPVVAGAVSSAEPPVVRPAPLFRRVPMFNVTRAPREAASGERTEPQLDDLAKRLESSLEGALGDRAEPTSPAVAPASTTPVAGEVRPGLRISPARFSPVMRAGATSGTPFVPTPRPAPLAPVPAPAAAPPAAEAGLGGSGLSLEQDLVRQLELTLAKEAEDDAKARATASSEPSAPLPEKAPIDPFEDLEAEMATLLGRNLPPRS